MHVSVIFYHIPLCSVIFMITILYPRDPRLNHAALLCMGSVNFLVTIKSCKLIGKLKSGLFVLFFFFFHIEKKWIFFVFFITYMINMNSAFRHSSRHIYNNGPVFQN